MAFQYSISRSILMPLVILLSLPSMEILNAEDQVWYRKAREDWLGIKVEDISPPGEKREGHFKDLEDALGVVGSWYDSSDGPFMTGDEISYADVTVCGWLMWAKRSLGSEEWSRILGWHDGRWARLMGSLEKYEAVDV